MENLPAVFQAMIGRYHQAVTVGKMVRIGSYIVDSCVIEATPAAAVLYGVDNPKELIGCWQSMLQHPDDVRLGRILAQARRRGVEVPAAYTSRIRQLRPPHTYVTVTKEVCQLTLDNDIYWFTVLSEAQDLPLMEQEDFWENLEVPDDVYSYLTNCVSVAETERAIKRGGVCQLWRCLTPGIRVHSEPSKWHLENRFICPMVLFSIVVPAALPFGKATELIPHGAANAVVTLLYGVRLPKVFVTWS